MVKSVIVLLLAILAILQYRLWISDDGLPSLLRLHYAVEKQAEDNKKLEERNTLLSAEVTDLKSGLEALEERARSELGMVEPGETFFHVIEDENDKSK